MGGYRKTGRRVRCMKMRFVSFIVFSRKILGYDHEVVAAVEC